MESDRDIYIGGDRGIDIKITNRNQKGRNSKSSRAWVHIPAYTEIGREINRI